MDFITDNWYHLYTLIILQVEINIKKNPRIGHNRKIIPQLKHISKIISGKS